VLPGNPVNELISHSQSVLGVSIGRENEYWERHYRDGGTSGAGSIGKEREWKWKIVQEHAGKIDDVLDVGCGDLSFWEDRDCFKYLGIDISETIIKQNRSRRPTWQFKAQGAEVLLDAHARIVLCMDVLFHIMDDDAFTRILQNLCYSTEWIFIHTWSRNPFDLGWALRRLRHLRIPPIGWILTGCDGEYEKYRPFAEFLPIFHKASFDLVNRQTKGVGVMYVFKRGALE